MKKIDKPTKKTCNECGKKYIPLSALGRPLGEKSINWKGRRFCSKSCSGKSSNRKRSINWKAINAMRRANAGRPSTMKGKKLSEELKRRIKPSFEACRKGGLASRKILAERNPTSIEKIVYEALKEMGFIFETQKLINGKFLVDAYIPSLNLVIEADGKYWHELDHIKKKDKAENAYLTKCGYNLLRLSEKEILNNKFIERIEVR